jgi:hypothetical protein
VVAFIGTLVLAHMLVPADFGVVAFGAIIVTTGDFFADGGLGASLIRKAGAPTVDELRTLLGFQLAVAVVIALGLAVVGSQTGTVGGVTAIMACSLPLLALRAPHAIALERDLEYRAIASINSRNPWPTTAGASRRSGRAGAYGAWRPLPWYVPWLGPS